MIKRLAIIFILAGFGILLINGGTRAMSIFGSEFQSKYKVLFQDVEKLNAYTRTHKVELTGESVKEIKINKAEFHGATFKKVKWEDVTFDNSIFNNVVFEDCEFLNSSFNAAKFVNCVFKNCKIHYTKMNRAVFKNGQFNDCDIEKSGMVKWMGDEVTFNGCKILDTPLAQGNIKFAFHNTNLDGVRVMMTEGNHSLLIEGGLLSEVDFSKSHFSTVTLRRVRQGEGPTRFDSVTAESFRFEDVDMTRGVSLARVKTTLVSIDGGTFRGATEGSIIDKIYARKANLFMYDMSEATMPYVNIDNCEILNLAIWECNVKELLITNSTANGIDATDFKADIVLWDNVILDGKIDLTNAQVNDFRPTRLKRGPRLQLITTGSNMRF
jgi:uncharacterized protein YjbI with pentapeptide repeats